MQTEGKDRESRIKLMKNKLKGEDFRENFRKHRFTLFPEIEIAEPIPEDCTIFKSAMAPIKMGWKGKDL